MQAAVAFLSQLLFLYQSIARYFCAVSPPVARDYSVPVQGAPNF